MGTRGIVGFTVGGQDKFAYNHFDSYPDGLGEDVVNFVKNTIAESMNNYGRIRGQAIALRPIDTSRKPTELEVHKLKKWTNLGVSNQSEEDWYCLLRDTQGNPANILECGFFEDSLGFIKDSLFCEYAYIINFDTDMLEMYEGFQKEPHDKGRFSNHKPKKGETTDGYYPCALVSEYPFTRIPDDWKKDFDDGEE